MSLLKPFIFFVALVWDRSSDGFDYYTVAYQWPRTFQKINNLTNVLVNYWTIHGCWPSNDNGNHPRFCNNDAFNWDIIPQNVKERMQIMWPNLRNGDHQAFWTQQWTRHGTCSGMGVNEYFTMAIELSDRYNIMQILSNEHIRPNGFMYYILDIRNTVEQYTDRWPTITQTRVFQDFVPWLFEIHICFNLKYHVIDCPDRPGEFLRYPPPVEAPVQQQQKMLNGQNSISISYSFVILIVILSNV